MIQNINDQHVGKTMTLFAAQKVGINVSRADVVFGVKNLIHMSNLKIKELTKKLLDFNQLTLLSIEVNYATACNADCWV